MPELPEVETVARTLAPHIENNIILSAQILRPSTLHELSLPLTSIEGARINQIKRRAKLLVFELNAPASEPIFLIAHLRMTGKMLPKNMEKETNKHTRAVFNLQKPDGEGQKLFFDDTRAFGKLLICNSQILDGWDFWKTLGPEPLEMKATDLFERLKGSRPIKSCLLDQKIIAGIGNIYADETLFAAGISPLRSANSISSDESAKLMREIKKILKTAIAKKGSSIRDYRDANGAEGSFQKGFNVYGRAQKECKKCGAILQMQRLAGRSTVFCPICQK